MLLLLVGDRGAAGSALPHLILDLAAERSDITPEDYELLLQLDEAIQKP
jgi:hypothetical protein